MKIQISRERVMIEIDKAHRDLIYGLIVASKPKSILELGFGTGRTSNTIIEAINFNEIPVRYDIVDNWHDWGGVKPEVVDQGWYKDYATFVTSTEEDFVMANYDKFKYDFIVSDADHANTHKWFWHIYSMVRGLGILVAHDVGGEYPGLHLITDMFGLGDKYVIFNQNSRGDEKCDRGLLVIFK